MARAMRALSRNGTLAVFLIRKIPAPFVIVNVLLGASAVGYREFVIGTTLGMTAMVIALAGFGYQLAALWRDPSPGGTRSRGSMFLAIPLSLAWLINRRLRARSGDVYSVSSRAERALAIVRPGQNCWRVERAERFYCIQDAADHFRLVRQAILQARDTVFILGWDIQATLDLLPDPGVVPARRRAQRCADCV